MQLARLGMKEGQTDRFPYRKTTRRLTFRKETLLNKFNILKPVQGQSL